MNRLKNEMAKKDAAIKKREKERKKAVVQELPEYNLNGKVVRKPKRERKRRTRIVIASVVVVLLGIVYLPSLFLSPFENSNDFVVTPDFTAIHKASIQLQNNPDADWDEDGIKNSEELMLGTNPYFIDTDNDGLSDYTELYITNTQATKQDKTLVSKIKAQDEAAGNAVNTPYKLNDVILWADDIESKTYGGVIRSHSGYRFCSFRGWVQFPTGKYAYGIEDGIHELLEYRETENAWYIASDCEVVLSDEPLEMVYKLEFFGKWKVYVSDNWFGKMLSAMLPADIGVITCSHTAKKDTWADMTKEIKTPIKKIEYDASDKSRFGINQNKLPTLAKIYQTIDAGHSVLCSLFSPEYGETIVIVYGYTEAGDLLIADKDNLKPIGKLEIKEQIHRLMNKDGSITRNEYFDFKGYGFDSEINKDRIAFFAAATSDGQQDINLAGD